ARGLYRIYHLHGLEGGAHVVDADDVRATEGGRRHARHRAMDALVDGRAAEQVADEGFARGADEQREVGKVARQHVQLRDQLDVLLLRLAEADAGVEHDLLAADTAALGLLDAPAPTAGDILEDVCDRLLLVHRLEGAA